VKLETGLQAIVRDGTEGLEQALDFVYGSALVKQRCIFQKLRNVSGKWGGSDRKVKKLLMEQAAAVYQATSSLEGMVREVVRSTSRLERTNRELRRKFRQVGCFSSPKGAEVAVYIQVTRLNAESG
jgi:transposase-like protein